MWHASCILLGLEKSKAYEDGKLSARQLFDKYDITICHELGTNRRLRFFFVPRSQQMLISSLSIKCRMYINVNRCLMAVLLRKIKDLQSTFNYTWKKISCRLIAALYNVNKVHQTRGAKSRFSQTAKILYYSVIHAQILMLSLSVHALRNLFHYFW